MAPRIAAFRFKVSTIAFSGCAIPGSSITAITMYQQGINGAHRKLVCVGSASNEKAQRMFDAWRGLGYQVIVDESTAGGGGEEFVDDTLIAQVILLSSFESFSSSRCLSDGEHCAWKCEPSVGEGSKRSR